MKFIREMITRKNRSPEMDARSDEDGFEFDDAARGNSGSATKVSMPSIQARLQSALEKSETKIARQERPDNGRRPVEDFRDIVGSRAKPQSQDNEQCRSVDDLDIDDETEFEELSDVAEAKNPEVDVASLSPEASLDLESMNALGLTSTVPQSSEVRLATATQDWPDASNQAETPQVAAPLTLSAVTSSGPEATHAQLPAEPNGSFAASEDEDDGSEPADADLSTNLGVVTKTVLSEVAKMPPPIPQMVEVPAPAAGRSGRRAGRVKTRLLGFEHAHGAEADPFNAARENAYALHGKFPVGWIVVLKGPGRGSSFVLSNGVSQIGRGEDQAVKLDFGDSSISRSNHAAIAYDSEQRTFFIGHGGKANLVRLNNKPVLSTEEITHGDLIRIGETVLRFVGLCGPDFDWETSEDENVGDAAIA